MELRALLGASAIGFVLGVAACGGNTITEGGGGTSVPLDAGPDATNPPVILQDASVDSAAAAALFGDASSVAACSACAGTVCSSTVESCLASNGCQAAIGCAVAQCIPEAGESVNPNCLTGCVTSAGATTEVLNVISCVAVQCSSPCSAFSSQLP